MWISVSLGFGELETMGNVRIQISGEWRRDAPKMIENRPTSFLSTSISNRSFFTGKYQYILIRKFVHSVYFPTRVFLLWIVCKECLNLDDTTNSKLTDVPLFSVLNVDEVFDLTFQYSIKLVLSYSILMLSNYNYEPTDATTETTTRIQSKRWSAAEEKRDSRI